MIEPVTEPGSRAGRRWSLALLALALALAGCHPTGTSRGTELVVPVVAGGTWGSWRTLRAEHKVTIVARAADGKEDQRALRGVIAVERPGRFRLRALGPGGITLFDLLSVDGKTSVLRSLRDPQGELFGRLLASIAGDLAAAYDLRPRPSELGQGGGGGGRSLRVDGRDVLIVEPLRTVRLSEFRETGRGPAPTRMKIESTAGGYRVAIEAEGTILDDTLDPELFQAPTP